MASGPSRRLLFQPATAPYADFYLKYFKTTAQSSGLELIAQPVADLAALETVSAAQAREPNTGFVLMPSGLVSGHTSEIAALMAQNRLPAVHSTRAFAESGGLMSYGNDMADNYRQAANSVDRILKGEKPGGAFRPVPGQVRASDQFEDRESTRPHTATNTLRGIGSANF